MAYICVWLENRLNEKDKSVYLDDEINLDIKEGSFIEFELRNNTIYAYKLIGDYHE